MLTPNGGIAGHTNCIADLDEVRVDFPAAHVAERCRGQFPDDVVAARVAALQGNLYVGIAPEHRSDDTFDLDHLRCVVTACDGMMRVCSHWGAQCDDEGDSDRCHWTNSPVHATRVMFAMEFHGINSVFPLREIRSAGEIPLESCSFCV
jgi:hypothetical protein